MISPPSGISLTKCTVAPVTFTPRASAASCTFKPYMPLPQNDGISDGWIFRMRRGHFFDEALTQDAQKAREDDNVDLVLLEQQLDGRLKVMLNEARRHGVRGDVRLFRAFERVGACLRGNDERDLAVWNFAVSLRVEQSL